LKKNFHQFTHLKFHKEKEMAELRKLVLAVAVVALLTGLAIPAAAQVGPPPTQSAVQPFVCQTNAGVPPIVRSEGFAELVGDLVLACTGGVPTPVGQPVPQVNVTIFLSTNITSRLLSGIFNEALLIIDEPHSATRPARPILACGDVGASDTSINGLGVCGIVSTGDPRLTYDGTPNAYAQQNSDTITTVCDGVDADGNGPLPARPTANSFGCGRPNVFQGRTGVAQNPGQANSVVFLGVPLDPPGNTVDPLLNTIRILRVTNVRGDANFTGVSSTFQTSQIQMNVAINGNTSLAINNPQQIVAYVQRGLQDPSVRGRFDFVQCVDAFRPSLSGVIPSAPQSLGGSSHVTGMHIRLSEGFASSWKVQNWAEISDLDDVGGGFGNYNGVYYDLHPSIIGTTFLPPTSLPSEQRQNVPAAIYNTESGFTGHPTSQADSVPKPPLGIGTIPVTATPGVLKHRLGTTGTGIENAGRATQGTRLAFTFQNIPAGSTAWVPSMVFITRAGTNTITGIAVRVTTSSNGSGAYSPISSTLYQPGGSGNVLTWTQIDSTLLAVYEVIFADPFALEDFTVPVAVSFTSNLAQNRPDPTVTAQVAGGFAPFYDPSPTVRQPSATLPVPRFITGLTPQDLYRVNKCACNLLFPFVTNASAGSSAFDTGIALANASLDPGSTFGFLARPQSGTVQFWYYNTAPGNTPVPTQCTNTASPGTCPGTTVVPAGAVLTYVLSQGSAQWGLDNRAAGFTGYMIAQSQFQYCHAFAYISAQGAGPLTPGMSVGYLALVMDYGSQLPRTAQFLTDALDQ
jgi:hypothetical protein